MKSQEVLQSSGENAKISDTQDCLRGLFQDSYKVHDLATRIQDQSNKLKEISMNAAIASGHTGNQARVFNEIAKQIGIISLLMNEAIIGIHEHTVFMSNKMLEAVVAGQHRETFVRCLPLIERESNFRLVKKVTESLSSQLETLLSSIHARLVHLHPEQETLRLLINRIWSITTSLKVSAGTTHLGEAEFFFSIADALEKMGNETTEIMEKMTTVLHSVDHQLRASCNPTKGDQDAA